jgi:hypothetical protein
MLEDLMAFHQATFLSCRSGHNRPWVRSSGEVHRAVVMLGGAAGCRFRASTARITSPLAMPAASASAHAAPIGDTKARQLHRPPMQTLPRQSAFVAQTAPVAGPASEGLASLPVTASQATLEPGMRLSAETSTMP